MRTWNEDVRIPKPNKYGAKKTEIDGMVFASRKEARRWQELKLMERGGLITGLERQVPIELIPKTDKHRARYYVADFVYTDCETGKRVYEDAKGVCTQTYSLKKAIVYWRYGIEIVEV